MTVVGAIWFLVMAYFVARGVRITANAQWIMSSIEVLLLVIFGVLGIFHHHRVSFSLSWLGFSHFGSFSVFVAGALIAAFYYWGWDVSSNLGEETEDSQKNSGIGGIIGVLIVFLLFELFTICINMDHVAVGDPEQQLQRARGLGQVVGGGFGGKLMIIAVALSTIATLETTLIQVTRSLFVDVTREDPPGALRRAASDVEHAGVRDRGGRCASRSSSSSCRTSLGRSTPCSATRSARSACRSPIYYALAGFAAVVAFRKLAVQVSFRTSS